MIPSNVFFEPKGKKVWHILLLEYTLGVFSLSRYNQDVLTLDL